MSESLDTSLVRIRTIDGGIVGAGFLVGKCQVLTCAHVIADALGLTDIPTDPPLIPVVLDFPLLAPHTRLAAKVIFWCPVNEDGSGDIAGLQLLGEPPEGTHIAHFAPAGDVWEHPFRVFGFPAGYDGGVWATGRLLGRQATGWLMLEDVKTEGFPVTLGFSGGPVWDVQLQGIVGMVVAASRSGDKTPPPKTAFVIPFDVLAATWSSLQPITHQRIFLSAAPANTAFAERLRADLQAQGIVVWDEQHGPIDSCTDAEERVRQAIRAAQTVLLVDSPQARTSRTVKQHRYLADLYQRRIILAWVGNGKNTPSSSAGWQATVLVDAHSTPYETVLQWIEAALSQNRLDISEVEPPRGEPRNPYKGLRPFTADDRGDFFGRQRLMSELVNDVASLLPATSPGTDNERCLSIIGPSGSGKSSVVMAGLLPQLQQGLLPGSERWVYLEPMCPGKHPIETLTQTFKHHFPDISLKTLREDLEDDTTQGLHLLATQLVKESGSRVVLLVDQFEELFTQTETEDERQRFIDLLLTAATIPSGPLLVLLTLRADFYDRPMQYPVLSHLMQAHQRQVLPMDAEDLRATIEQPAALPDVQLSFEGNLVGDLLFEMQGQSEALPLLQFSLDQLFVQRVEHRLTLSAYHEMGGIKGALSRHAEQIYTTLPSEEHRRLAQALFLRLMELGVSLQDTTRRRAALSEFTFDDPARTRLMREVIDAFITARLLTASEVAGTTILEVSHEAVLREWRRVAEWLHNAHGDILIQQDLSKDTAEWEQHGKTRDRLYRGSQLKDVQAWSKRNRPSEREAAFLRASAAQRTLSLVSLVAIALLLVSSIGFAGWFFVMYPNPTVVRTLQDNVNGSLRYCIRYAPPGSTISFASNLKGGTIELTGGGLEFPGGKKLMIAGPGANLLTVADSGRNVFLRIFKGAIVAISGLSFKNSRTADAAFIWNDGTLTLTNSIISANETTNSFLAAGGGMYNSRTGTARVEGSTFSDNLAYGGKGIGGGIDNEGSLTVVRSVFSRNKAHGGNGFSGSGGGIRNFKSGTAKVEDSTFSDNSAYGGNNNNGGGISNAGKLTVINSTFLRNKARGSSGSPSYGGGIFNVETGIALVEASTFFENSANDDKDSQGGGIGNKGKLTVVNSTFLKNTVLGSNGPIGSGGSIANTNTGTAIIRFSTLYQNTSGGGGGIWNEPAKNGQVIMSGTLVIGNSAQEGPDIAGTLASEGYNLIENVTAIKGLSSVDRQVTFADLKIDPTLHNNGGPTQTLTLLPGSSAIDAVPGKACSITVTDVSSHTITITTDQRGVPRLNRLKNACDSGAYESSY